MEKDNSTTTVTRVVHDDANDSHPVATGVGVAGGLAAGAAIGAAVGGPVGAVVGGAIGAVAGGMTGHGIAEATDSDSDEANEQYWQEQHRTQSYATADNDNYTSYAPAYQYGTSAARSYDNRNFQDVEPELRSNWEREHANSNLDWESARPAVENAFNRTIQLRQERLRATTTPVQAGEAQLHKEVVTETQTLQVPVTREELVIERHPVNAATANAGAMDAGEIGSGETVRIPLTQEQVNISKDTVVTEEVSIGKKQVQETQQVQDTIKREELRVDHSGKTSSSPSRAA